MRDAMRGDAIRIQGDGTPRRSYMYAADLAVWLWTILFQGQAMEDYNVGSDQSVSILELARAVADSLEVDIPIQVAKEAVPGAEVLQYVPCTEKARRDLGLRCAVPLHKAICRTAAWHGFGRCMD